MTADQKELASIIFILLTDIVALWILFRVVRASVQIPNIILISISLVGLTLLEIGFFAYILSFVAIHYLGSKYSSAEGTDMLLVTVFGVLTHFSAVIFFGLF